MTYRCLSVSWPSETLDGVVVATTFVDRLLGLGRRNVPALIIDAPSVHTFWMRTPIMVVEVSQSGIVTGVHRVRPRRIHRRRATGPMLEIRGDTIHPAVGEQLTLLPCP